MLNIITFIKVYQEADRAVCSLGQAEVEEDEAGEEEGEAEAGPQAPRGVRVESPRDVVWKLGSRVSMTNVQGKKRRENHTYNF